jgi:N6-L-threonylcarbamoyladenine synthase
MIPDVMPELDRQRIACVAVSSMPRDREDSYMPVFVAGHMAAAALSVALQVPLIETSHQQGHISAALIGNGSLRGKSFIAVHLSGGTTELLFVDPDLKTVSQRGTRDINAGQFVDRIGVELGCSFPAGSQLEKLAAAATGASARIPSSVSGSCCSFSGAETFARKMIAEGERPEEAAYAVLDCISRTMAKLIQNAANKNEIFDVLLAGGVASSALLKTMLSARSDGSGIRLYFAQKGMSGDNAAGNAVLAREWAATAA